MNQDKLEVVKQETARVNIDILGISELKWTRMGEFNSDDHFMYYCGQESLKRNGVAIICNERVQNAVLGGNLKDGRMISVRFQGKQFNITIIQVYAPTWRRQWQPTPVLLALEIPWIEELGAGYYPWGHKESGTSERLHFTSLHFGLFC